MGSNLMHAVFSKLFCVGMALGIALSASAKIELHSLFGDNMILQRDAGNSIWGWVQPGAAVEVVCADGEVRSGELCALPMYDLERLIPRGKLVDIPEVS